MRLPHFEISQSLSLSLSLFTRMSGMSESTGPETLNFISKHRWRTGSCGPVLDGLRLKIANPDANGDGEVRTSVCLCVCMPVSMAVSIYRRSGNFRVKKLSYDKFSCKKFFCRNDPLPHLR